MSPIIKRTIYKKCKKKSALKEEQTCQSMSYKRIEVNNK